MWLGLAFRRAATSAIMPCMTLSLLAAISLGLGVLTVIAWIGSSVLPRSWRMGVGIAAYVLAILFFVSLGWLFLGWMVAQWGSWG
jgi:hypothetical protein